MLHAQRRAVGSGVGLGQEERDQQPAAPAAARSGTRRCRASRRGVSSQPPTIGASAGARPKIIAICDITRWARWPGKMSRTMARLMICPAPALRPCTARPTSSNARLGASAHAVEASTNRPLPTRITGLRPTRVRQRAVKQAHHRERQQVDADQLLQRQRRACPGPRAICAKAGNMVSIENGPTMPSPARMISSSHCGPTSMLSVRVGGRKSLRDSPTG